MFRSTATNSYPASSAHERVSMEALSRGSTVVQTKLRNVRGLLRQATKKSTRADLQRIIDLVREEIDSLNVPE